MDIPEMSYYKYHKLEDALKNVWQGQMDEDITAAGKEEYAQATERKDIDGDGIQYITVYLDGGWSKRSYGHSFNANSGLAVIIGKAAGKVLFLGVRNKYCSICARAANKETEPNAHICYRNWSASSCAMEADIVVEGFSKSIEMHGLRYKKFIADGDSNVFAKIQERVPYGREVEKIDCTNHAIKNYGKALYKMQQEKSISVEGRKMLTKDVILKLQKTAHGCIYNNAGGDVEQLKNDLSNSAYHVFDDHSNCSEENCKSAGINSTNKILSLKSSGVLYHITSALDRLVSKAHRLIDNDTNNRSETFMAIVAKFTAGKRLNLIQRGSYQTKVLLSGAKYNGGPTWHTKPWKVATNKNPGKNFQTFLDREQRKAELVHERNALTSENPAKKRKATAMPSVPNIYYGKNAQQAFTEEEMNSEKERILKRLTVTEEDQIRIEHATVGQFDNMYYKTERQDRLTASKFGAVLKRRDYTPCHVLVKEILNNTDRLNSPAITFGRQHEIVAINKFIDERKTDGIDLSVQPSGLIIDKANGFLAASPDGIIGKTHLVEVKCLYSCAKTDLSLEDFVRSKRSTNCCLHFRSDGQLQLKRRHNYYFQVQGQLNIAEKDVCYFIVYVRDSDKLFVEEIQRDAHIWTTWMLPKLSQFYMECVLPEIVRGNIPRGLKCLDPKYILEAMEEKRLENEKRKKPGIQNDETSDEEETQAEMQEEVQ